MRAIDAVNPRTSRRASRGVAIPVAVALLLAPAGLRAQQAAGPTGTKTTPGAAPASTSAQPAREATPEEIAEGKHAFESGMKFFNQGNYEAARTQFDAAYKLSRFPALLYNLGRTAEKQNQPREAIRFYEQYQATNPPDAPDIEVKLRALRKAEGSAEATPQTSPAPSPQSTETPSGAPSKWLVGTQKLPPIPALALAGTGAAFLIIGIGCGAGALSASGQLEGGNGQTYRGAYSDAASRGASLNRAAIAFDVIGALSLAGGGAWIGYWFYMKLKKPDSLPTALRIIPAPGGLGIAGSY